MTKFIIKEVSNGWILRGPRDKEEPGRIGLQVELFLASIHAVADILTTWQSLGFAKAAARASEKYKGGGSE